MVYGSNRSKYITFLVSPPTGQRKEAIGQTLTVKINESSELFFKLGKGCASREVTKGQVQIIKIKIYEKISG
jgi:hypothetical protein